MPLCSRLAIAFERNSRLAPHHRLLPFLLSWLLLVSGRRWTVSVFHNITTALYKRPLIRGTFLRTSQRRTCKSQITYMDMTNTFLTIRQRCLGRKVGTSPGTPSLTHLQTLCKLHLVSHTVTDMNDRCCSEPLPTTAEINHSPLSPWDLPSNTSPQSPS